MEEKPSLLIIGNSNVGKSTITRLLLPNSGVYKGKIGKTPGSTVLLKPITQKEMPFQIVDLPGFGYMKKESRRREEHIKKQLVSHIEHHHEKYFFGLVVLNVLRIEDELEKYFYQKKQTIPLSFEMITFLLEFAIPILIIINKTDKISTFDEKRIMKFFIDSARRYGLNVVHLDQFSDDYQIELPYLEFSGLKKTNLGKLKKTLNLFLSNYNH
ncbi:MAG: Small GTP-binding domain protein [Promethearchaeota archaeon]|nr:MAG: Small GTP-binding domain protein [Candidatus Lokiarchaeota archaeon]